MMVTTPRPAHAQAAGTGVGYLSTNGNRIVDSAGATVRLTGINWFGMETGNHTFHGLWASAPATWRGQLDRMADLGCTTIRIPFVGEPLAPGTQAYGSKDYTNTDLVGQPLPVFLYTAVAHIGRRGLSVI